MVKRGFWDGTERLEEALGGRVSLFFVRQVCLRLGEPDSAPLREELLRLLLHEEGRKGANAAWIASLLPAASLAWLRPHEGTLIAYSVTAPTATLQRLRLTLILHLLQAHPPAMFNEPHFRLLDFCLSHIVSATAAVAVRSLCIKLADLLTRMLPELRPELLLHLEMMPDETLTPAIRAAWRRAMGKP